MADENKIGLEAVFESKEFQDGIKAYNDSVKEASGATEDEASSMGQAWEGLSAIGALAWAGLAAGIAAATAEIYLATGAAMEAQDVMVGLEFQVEKAGDASGITTDQVGGLADSLSKVLPIDDEVITSAITMGMRFDNVTKDNIEPLIKAAADLSISTGKDLPNTMKTLALAIADPDKAMRLFRDANITLTDAEEKQLKSWKESGDVLSAQGFILDKVNGKVGGLAETMGKTASGKMVIMQTAIGNLQEALGGGFLTPLAEVIDKITVFANDPKTIEVFGDIGASIGGFASTVIDNVPSIMTMIEDFITLLQENKPVVVGILAVITAAMAAFAVTSAIAFLATAEISIPLIAAIAAIGVVSALLFQAWTEDWGGIRTKLQAAWLEISPVLETLQKWLGENIPIAIQFMSTVWETVLLPALQTVFGWWADNILPIYVNAVVWLGKNIPAAITILSKFWTGTLLPAIQKVSAWINTNLMPLFRAVAGLVGSVVGLAVKVLAGLWQNVLFPAIQKVATYLSGNVTSAFNNIMSVINPFLPLLKQIGEWITNYVVSSLNSLIGVIKTATDWFISMQNSINLLQLPSWLTPGSPTPLEIGLVGINSQLGKMAQMALPAIQTQMSVMANVQNQPGIMAPSTSISNSSKSTRNYLFGSKFEVNNKSGLMDLLDGLA